MTIDNIKKMNSSLLDSDIDITNNAAMLSCWQCISSSQCHMTWQPYIMEGSDQKSICTAVCETVVQNCLWHLMGQVRGQSFVTPLVSTNNYQASLELMLCKCECSGTGT
jgi:hypothetical protein